MEKFFCKVFEGENLGTGVFLAWDHALSLLAKEAKKPKKKNKKITPDLRLVCFIMAYFIKHYENLVKTNIDKL